MKPSAAPRARHSGWPAAALVLAAVSAPAQAAATAGASGMPWWGWPLALFVACFVMGIVAVPAGIGGGTLFVPIIGGFFPFHLDFVRGAGTLVALASALAAGPMLLRTGLGSLRLALPLALTASVGSMLGASVGMAIPASALQTALGTLVLGIVVLMLRQGHAGAPVTLDGDALSRAMGLQGSFQDRATGRTVDWHAHRTPAGLAVFFVIGVLGGLFGIGAGWANVPALSLLMGVPMKVAAGTSGVVLSLASSSAAWVYFNRGATLPIVAVPAVVGMMLGAVIGARLLHVLHGVALRRLVIGVLLFAGLRALLKGTGLWA